MRQRLNQADPVMNEETRGRVRHDTGGNEWGLAEQLELRRDADASVQYLDE